MEDKMGTFVQTSNKTPEDDDRLIYFKVPNLTKAELERKGRVYATVNEKELAIYYIKGIYYAVLGKCPHAGGPLLAGEIEDVPAFGPCVKCPWHGWKFRLNNGECVFPHNRHHVKATIYPVKINCPEHTVSVGFTEIDPEIFTRPLD